MTSAKSLARAGRVDELRNRADAGDPHAGWAYSNYLVVRRRVPEAIEVLRPVADSGVPDAQRRLARLLAGEGRCAEAMAQLRQAPAYWQDIRRVEGWLQSRQLAEWTIAGVEVRQDYLDELRRAGDADALSWIVLLWWRPRLEAAVALLADIGPSDWLHERLVNESQGWHLKEFRATAIDLLDGIYPRTRAALLLLQARRDEAIAQLRSAGEERDLAAVLAAEQPAREIRIGDHPDPVSMNGLEFSPDGALLAAWGHGVGVWARVVLWDVATGEPRHTKVLSSPVLGGVRFRRDGTVEELPAPYPRYPIRLTGRGRVVAVLARGRLEVRGAVTGRLIHEVAAPDAFTMAFHPDGTVLAVGGSSGVRLWEVRTRRLVRTIDTPTVAVAFSPDGTVLATADSLSGTIRLWNLAD